MKARIQEKTPSALPRTPCSIWPDGGIGHPCGHESSFEDGCLDRDKFECPICGQRWHMVQDPPIVHASGWVEPGNRRMVIERQIHLPLAKDIAVRKALAAMPKPPLSRVLKQAASSRAWSHQPPNNQPTKPTNQ
jgi:hypothetical protein